MSKDNLSSRGNQAEDAGCNDKTTIRIIKGNTGNYTKMPNSVAQDPRMTYEAKGLHWSLLSRPPDWIIRVRTLTNQASAKNVGSPHGKAAVYRILKELINFGYANRECLRDDQGRIICFRYSVADSPIFLRNSTNTSNSQEHVHGQPSNGKPNNGKSDTINERVPLKNKGYKGEINTHAHASGEYDQRFLKFWNAYPRKKAKGDAHQAFIELRPSEELLECMLSAISRALSTQTWQTENGRYIPYPAKWLRVHAWEDEDNQIGDSLKGKMSETTIQNIDILNTWRSEK